MASLPDAVTQGRKAALEAVRDRLAAELDVAEGRDAAPLARELRAVLSELESMTTGREAHPSDDLAARRAARRAAAGL